MSLDLFQEDVRTATARAQRSLANDLPATFSDTFEPAWTVGLLFGQSVARSNARYAAMEDHLGDIYKRTGVSLPNPELAAIGQDGLGEYNAAVEKLATQYPHLGLKALTDEDVDRMAVDAAKKARIDLATAMQRERTLGGSLGLLAGSAAAGVTDPVNLVLFPIAAPEALGIVGTTLAWGAIGAGSQAAIEVAGAGFRERVQPGYQQSGEMAANIAEAGAFAGVLGGGLRGVANLWTRVKTGAWPRSVRDAGNIVDSEASIADTNLFPGAEGEVAHRTALQQSIDQLVSGRPVEVDNVVTPSILAAYEQRLAPVMQARGAARTAGERGLALEREAARLPATMERLSEVQLDEVRQTLARVETGLGETTARLDRQAAGIAAEREGVTARQAGIEGQRAEIEQIRADLADRQQRLGQARPPADEATQARLDAIDADLARAAGPDARALLEAERASITETLAKTSAGDRRLIASLQQEIRGLEKALARAERGVAKTEASVARTTERLAAAERKVVTTRDLAASRAESQRDVVLTEMRKSVSALADEGYGLKLPRDDAQAIADRILAATDAEAADVLRGVTAELVERAHAARQAQGVTTVAGERQARRAEYHTEQTRKAVTALAREVGYEIPREEAAALAARLVKASDDEALAILDEFMLRPRTINEPLPGTVGARDIPAAKPEAERVNGKRVTIENATPEQLRALADETTPARVAELRVDPLTDEAAVAEADRLRATKDVQVPVGVAEQDGVKTPVFRSLDDMMDEADRQLAAAKEIAACATPQQEAAA
ncbi:MAG: hypothetical protein IT520_11835 [Burkholderiales bacterium]|nr:hypothetical protein [Burkholderiales bacterium]